MAVPANLFKHALSLEAPKRVALVDALLASLDQADKAIGLKRLRAVLMPMTEARSNPFPCVT